MALEYELHTRLLAQCPRVFTLTADFGTQRPYVTWQHIGGKAFRWSENTAPDIRNAAIQVNVWADTKQQAFGMLQAIQEALCEMTEAKFTATPMEEPMDSFIENQSSQETDQVKGAMQSFSIWGERF
ncbi:MAG: DUF3168 domain-containing protein [Acidovorax sp.]